jgi:N-acyl-D-aspartate/D-glutamate deacylase
MHDLIIDNALVCDGTGAALRPGGIAIADGKIAAVGKDLGTARERIDAHGLVLAPGIIDAHTHFDAQVTWDRWLTPSSSLGVTTAVIGNCGFTIAPCRPEHRDLTMRNLTHVEGMSIDVLRQGIAWDFQSFPEYLNAIEGRGLGLNVAAFFGHSSLRTFVMGEDAHRRAATADEIAQMRELVCQAMQAGAIGFATSTAGQHNGEAGVPMPSRLAASEELTALVKAMGEAGHGVFMLTKGGSTSIRFLESLAADSGRPVVIAALLHNSTVPDATFEDLREIAAAQGRGRRLWGQVSCCPLTNDFTLKSPYPFEGLDAWRPAMEAPEERLPAIYADAQFRAAIRDELKRPAKVRLFNGEWHKLDLLETRLPQNRALEGKSIGELAKQAGKDPLDFMLDLALAEDLDTIFTAVLLNSDEDAVGRMLNDPHANIALSDAGAHLTFFCDAGFGLYLLGHWVRELEVMSLERAVHHLTGRQAAIFGIPGRGELKPGNAADLMLFDPATIGRGEAHRVHDLPGGAPRLTTPATGLHGVWVNGQRIVDDGGALIQDAPLSGQLLRRFLS